MKITSLLPTLAFLTFAITASAQSDPSVGGSFDGLSRTAGTVNVNAGNPAPKPPSFWNRLLGRGSTSTHDRASTSDRSHGWFGHHAASTNTSTGSSHRWFGHSQAVEHNADSAHRSASGMSHTPPADRTHATREGTTTSPRSSGWHLPFFHRR